MTSKLISILKAWYIYKTKNLKFKRIETECVLWADEGCSKGFVSELYEIQLKGIHQVCGIMYIHIFVCNNDS